MMGRICYSVYEEGNPITVEAILDNILTMVFAGHDTTNKSMGTALYYLDQNPDIKSAIAKEVRNFQEPLDFDEMKNAPVLNAFIAESWRICPPIGGGFRRVTQDVEFQNQWKIGKGQMFVYSVYLALSDERIYPDPNTFSIARFLPSDHPLAQNCKFNGTDNCGLDPHGMSSAYPVFGAGVHGCLGHHFAKMEMRIFLTRLLQRYDVEVRNPKRVEMPIHGWECEFQLTPTS